LIFVCLNRFIILGAGFQYKFNFAGLVVGWVLGPSPVCLA
jgi:hypothetical protein